MYARCVLVRNFRYSVKTLMKASTGQKFLYEIECKARWAIAECVELVRQAAGWDTLLADMHGELRLEILLCVIHSLQGLQRNLELTIARVQAATAGSAQSTSALAGCVSP